MPRDELQSFAAQTQICQDRVQSVVFPLRLKEKLKRNLASLVTVFCWSDFDLSLRVCVSSFYLDNKKETRPNKKVCLKFLSIVLSELWESTSVSAHWAGRGQAAFKSG